MIPLRSPAGRPFAIGHRGAMGHAPENTMPSFELGWQMGAGLLELGVHVTADDQLAVIHDATLDRTTNGSGWVKDHTIAQIQALDAGGWYGPAFAGGRVPLLGEVIEFARGKIGLAIEVKNGPIFYPRIAELLIAELRRRAFVEEVLVISFDHPVLRQIKDLEPRIATGMLYGCRLHDPVAIARAVGASVLRPRHDYLAPEDVAELHAAGLAVSPWTANDEATMRRLIPLGVDSMGTNYPDLLKRLVGDL